MKHWTRGWRFPAALLSVLILAAAVPLSAWADPDERMSRGGHDGMSKGGHEGMSRGGHSERDSSMHDFVGRSLGALLRHAKELGLSEEQMTKLKTSAGDYDKAKIRGEADLKLAELDVQTLIHDEKSDLAAIETAMKKSDAAHTALRLEGIKTIRAASAILTPEQREKWRSRMTMRHKEDKGEQGYSGRPREKSQEMPKKETQ
jgi:periplasmic protein CpxP/Spy